MQTNFYTTIVSNTTILMVIFRLPKLDSTLQAAVDSMPLPFLTIFGQAMYDLDLWLSDLLLPKIAEPPITCPNQFKPSLFNVIWRRNGPKSGFLTIFGIIMTLTFDLLTTTPNQFIFVPMHTKADLVKFSQVVYKISCSQTFSRCTHRQTTQKHNASNT